MDPVPIVSVIITTFNHGDFIAQAIESVLSQDFRDFEMIIVDDASEDHTASIVRAYATNNPERIRLLRHPGGENRGLVPSYQLGIANAAGQYIAFLEGDDWWDQGFLSGKVDIFERHPEVGLVFSKQKVVPTGLYGIDMVFRQWLLSLTIPRSRPFRNFSNLIKRNNIATFSSFALRAKLLTDLKYPKDERLVFFDWYFLMQLSQRTFFYFDETSRVYWRQHRASTMGKQTMSSHQERLVRFVEGMFSEIAAADSIGTADDRAYFSARDANVAHFCSFYRSPGPGSFIAFFRQDPVWSVESLGSVLVNQLKSTSHIKRKRAHQGGLFRHGSVGPKSILKRLYTRWTRRHHDRKPDIVERTLFALSDVFERLETRLALDAGPPWSPTHNKIIIDITTRCNLRCVDCNRSVGQGQATTEEDMTVGQMKRFVEESIAQQRRWAEISVEGGEPTLHRQLFNIMDVLLEYQREQSPRTNIKLQTNGFGTEVEEIISRLRAKGVDVYNSAKMTVDQAHHCAFNQAPIDDPEHGGEDLFSGCHLPTQYGLGLTRHGFYPHPVCGGIDRVFGLGIGRKSLPSTQDDMKDQMAALCRFCGLYRYSRKKKVDDPVLHSRGFMSESWQQAYGAYQDKKPQLESYGE